MEKALSRKDLDQILLSITRTFLQELNRQRQVEILTLQSKLDQELGIDSLGRVELFHRIESQLNVELPEKLMIESQTLQDLSAGILAEHAHVRPAKTIIEHTQEKPKASPQSVQSLTQLLIERAKIEPERVHLILQDENGNEKTITYGDLYLKSKALALSFQSLGIEPGDTIALMLPTCEDFFYCFMGIMLCGAIAVPIYPPLSIHKIEEYALRESQILRNAEARLLITFDKAERLSELLKVFIPSLKAVMTANQLREIQAKQKYDFNQEDRPAMIQYTSGSTSLPKGVLLSHQKLLSNIRAVGEAIHITNADTGVSWLPLYHDMGLIGAWFMPFYQGIPIVIMSPLTFLARPERWLWALHYHRATLSAAPNFAYELCCKRIKDEHIKGLDLSSVRLLFNGAEKVNPRTLVRFTKKFAPYGLQSDAMFPVYGLAESAVALAFPPQNREPKIDAINRKEFEQFQTATPTTIKENTIEFVSCGLPIPGHEIRVVDREDKILPERKVGYLHFRGPSTMLGYYQQPEATKAVMHDEWVDTGDLAYLADGELYITGRKKDLIIKAGRNMYPEEIEEVTGQVDGVRKGCVIAFGVEDTATATEKVVVVAEVKDKNKALNKRISSDITEKITTVLGFAPDEIVLVKEKTIPKTSSGKLQRHACKQSYLQGKLTRPIAPQLQFIKLFVRGATVKVLSAFKGLFRYLYNFYIALLLLVSVPLIYLMSFLLTYRGFARFLKYWAKTGLVLIGCPVRVKGTIDKQKLIYVANHASYIDAVVLISLLPIDVHFVGKKELMQVPILGRILRKYQILTVDRVDFLNNLSDVETITQWLDKGASLAIFPEGTFTYATGLRTFKMGAFKVAVQTKTPICPIALAGTRNVLRGDEKLFSPGKINVTIGEIITPDANEWKDVLMLHDRARKQIAEHCGEQAIDY